MERDPLSHKGQNGKVAIVGGSLHMHGAPIFSALACEASGVDMLYPCIPDCHVEVTKNASNNFITSTFRENDLSKTDVSSVNDVFTNCNAAVIGPGIATFDTSQKAVQEILKDVAIPVVVDGGALQSWTFDALDGKQAIVTPHVGELGRMQGLVLEGKDIDELQDRVCTIANARGTVILLKGQMDVIGGPEGRCARIEGGNAGLTVGGTGDALAGLIAGLIAQGQDMFEACVLGATVIKRAGTDLYNEKGYTYTTMDVISQIPRLLHSYE